MMVAPVSRRAIAALLTLTIQAGALSGWDPAAREELSSSVRSSSASSSIRSSQLQQEAAHQLLQPQMGLHGAGQRRQRPVAEPVLQAQVFNLTDVRLIPDPDNFFQQAQDLNTQFLKYLEADRLLFTFRTIANLPQKPGATPYGGWIAPVGRMELVNGHFTGHFLSALAFTSAATGDPAIMAKSKYLVEELGKCQDQICHNNATHCGYLSAYYFSQLERMENHEGDTWATVYTLHKIMAGLLDTYENTANEQALAILIKMANFLKARIDAVIIRKGWAWWEQCLEVEFGGLNEVAFNLYAITHEEQHMVLGEYFYKARFMDPLAQSFEYALTGQHANTHLPEIIGVARGWEVTGNSTLSQITQFFYQILTNHYTYNATGGSNQGGKRAYCCSFHLLWHAESRSCPQLSNSPLHAEHWLFPDHLGTAIATIPSRDSAGFHTEVCRQDIVCSFSDIVCSSSGRALCFRKAAHSTMS
jgi:hypothetical protein